LGVVGIERERAQLLHLMDRMTAFDPWIEVVGLGMLPTAVLETGKILTKGEW